MPTTLEKIEQQISHLKDSEIGNILNDISACVVEIKKLPYKKEIYDKLFAKLEVVFSIVCLPKIAEIQTQAGRAVILGFFEKFAEIRRDYHNYFSEKRVERLAASVDFEKLTTRQKMDFIKNLNQIGFSDFPAKEKAQEILNECLHNLYSRTYKGVGWVGNAMHFLVQCKNLNLLSAENLRGENGELLREIIKTASDFIAENNTLNTSAAQASLDVLRYVKHVLKIEIRQDAQEFLQDQLSERASHSSEVHLRIFEKITEFLENKKGGEDEWRHKPKSKDKHEQDSSYTYGNLISIGVEQPYGEGLKGDIVVKNIKTGEVILVIEIDGSPHFLSPKIKTGKTRARDKVACELLGEARFMVIDEQDFFLFENSNYYAEKETPFLKKLNDIKNALEAELTKEASVHQSKKSRKESSASTKAMPAAVAAQESSAPKTALVKPPQKTKAQIQGELLEGFWQILESQPENIEEILLEEAFSEISYERISAKLHPFDFILQKYHEASEKEKENLKLTLNILCVYGFKQHDKKLENPLTSQASAAVDPERRSNFSSILENARKGNFDFVNIALRRNPFPKTLDEYNCSDLIEFARMVIVLEHNILQRNQRLEAQESFGFFSKIKKAPWFNEAQEALLAKALEDSNEEMVKAILARQQTPQFFLQFFKKNSELVAKICDLKSWSSIEKFIEIAKEDPALFEQVAINMAKITSMARLKDFSSFKDLKDAILKSKDTSPQALFSKAVVIYQFGVAAEDVGRSKSFLQQAISENHQDSKLYLAMIEAKEKASAEEIIEIYQPFIDQDSVGNVNYELGCLLQFRYEEEWEKRAMPYFSKALELGHLPTALHLGNIFEIQARFAITPNPKLSEALFARAEELFFKAADNHSAEGSFHAGSIFLRRYLPLSTRNSSFGHNLPLELGEESLECARKAYEYLKYSQNPLYDKPFFEEGYYRFTIRDGEKEIRCNDSASQLQYLARELGILENAMQNFHKSPGSAVAPAAAQAARGKEAASQSKAVKH